MKIIPTDLKQYWCIYDGKLQVLAFRYDYTTECLTMYSAYGRISSKLVFHDAGFYYEPTMVVGRLPHVLVLVVMQFYADVHESILSIEEKNYGDLLPEVARIFPLDSYLYAR